MRKLLALATAALILVPLSSRAGPPAIRLAWSVTIDGQVQLGILKAPLDVNAYSDLSLVKEAAARLD
jgi:hypothetical protein